MGIDAEGKRRQKWHTVHGTKKDAEAELARLVHEVNTGAYAEPDKMLVREYLDRWLKDYARVSVAPKTYERYDQIVRLHLSPSIGHIPLLKLKPLHIQAMEAEALVSGRKRRRKTLADASVATPRQNEASEPEDKKKTEGLSARSVLHLHRVLRTALQQAVKWQILPRNPADAVRPPRPERKEMQALDEDGTAKLLVSAQSTRVWIPVLLAVTTGMRRGEILGLRWSDVDLDNGVLCVRQALSKTQAEGIVFREPKTAKSRRTLALMHMTVDALKEHRKRQTEERLRLGPVFEDHGLVCAKEDGRPWHPESFTSAWRILCRDTGVTVRFHDLRHTHATQLLRGGIHPKVVSERLGHSTIALTLDTYSHVLPGMQEEAAAKLDAILQKALDGLPSAR